MRCRQVYGSDVLLPSLQTTVTEEQAMVFSFYKYTPNSVRKRVVTKLLRGLLLID